MSDSDLNNEAAEAPKGSRWQGILILFVGFFIGYISIVEPLQEAYAHVAKISWAGEFSWLSPPLILLGVLAIIFPSMTTNNTFLLKSKDKLSLAGWC